MHLPGSVPAAAATATPGSPYFILGYYLTWPGSGSRASFAAHYRDLSAIAPLWYSIHADASVHPRGQGDVQSLVAQAHRLGRRVLALVTNDGQDRILVSPTRRALAVRNLVDAVLADHVDGVNIDFENIDGTAAQGLVDFVAAVHARLAPLGRLTTVAVGPREQSALPIADQSAAYSYAALGRVSDYVVLMTYDQHGPGTSAGPIAAIGWVQAVARYALSQIPARSILLGVAAYGYDFAQPGTPTVTAQQAVSALPAGGARLVWDASADEPHYTAPQHDVWFEDSYSARFKLRLVRRLGLGGIALWYLGAEDGRFWSTLESTLR